MTVSFFRLRLCFPSAPRDPREHSLVSWIDFHGVARTIFILSLMPALSCHQIHSFADATSELKCWHSPSPMSSAARPGQYLSRTVRKDRSSAAFALSWWGTIPTRTPAAVQEMLMNFRGRVSMLHEPECNIAVQMNEICPLLAVSLCGGRNSDGGSGSSSCHGAVMLSSCWKTPFSRGS